MKTLRPPQLHQVRLTDPVFAPRQETCLNTTIPAAIAKTVETGRIQAFDLNWKEGMPNKPHIFWDSDVAKVLEGMAYALALRPDPELEKRYDQWVDKICSAQQPDGYLNSYFSGVEPEKRFTNLSHCHELYCAGHLMEAAVAGYEQLGKRKLLDALCRYADCLCSVFGRGPGKRRGWPGHEEIELALAKLYRLTGRERYLELLRYFINDRGTEPNFFAEEGHPEVVPYFQAQVPVREQKAVTGHAVRQTYLASGMADLAALDGDASLLDACVRLHRNLVTKRMYLTGGIGSSFHQEAFTQDYDLSNGSLMYAESCAAMGLAFFAVRMFLLTGENQYIDTVERCLYNGILSGISLSGDTFFYTNYLEVDEHQTFYNSGAKERRPWFNVSCCPTSFSRFLPQLGKFLYAIDEEAREIRLNIPAANHAELSLGGTPVRLEVTGRYPYDGNIAVTIGSSAEFTLNCRIPGWCRKWSATLNGERIEAPVLSRKWNAGDRLELHLEMPPQWIYSNQKITENNGRAAIMRGPVVYALEEVDQTAPVRELILRTGSPLTLTSAPEGLPAGTVAITGRAYRETFPDGDALYSADAPVWEETGFLAIPYALWQNRGETNMAVWNRRTADGTGGKKP